MAWWLRIVFGVYCSSFAWSLKHVSLSQGRVINCEELATSQPFVHRDDLLCLEENPKFHKTVVRFKTAKFDDRTEVIRTNSFKLNQKDLLKKFKRQPRKHSLKYEEVVHKSISEAYLREGYK